MDFIYYHAHNALHAQPLRQSHMAAPLSVKLSRSRVKSLSILYWRILCVPVFETGMVSHPKNYWLSPRPIVAQSAQLYVSSPSTFLLLLILLVDQINGLASFPCFLFPL